MKIIPILLLTFSIPSMAYGDEVATHAEAVINLRSLQEQYIQNADLSSDVLRAYATEVSQNAGRAATCRGVKKEDLPEIAEENARELAATLEQTLSILSLFSSNVFSLPTVGDYRSEFLRGVGQGCSEGDDAQGSEITEALEAINAVILLDKEISRRRSEILRLLSSQQ